MAKPPSIPSKAPPKRRDRDADRGGRNGSAKGNGNGSAGVALPADVAAPSRPRPNPIVAALHALASLWLTVPLLAMAVALVFVGTIAQTRWDEGIWLVQKKYFHSFIIWAGFIPLPGGFAIGTVLMANLLAAHAVRFKLAWKRAGILLIHAGVAMLLLNEVVTSFAQIEMQMTLRDGDKKNWAQNYQDYELAFIDTSSANEDVVVAIPASRLTPGARISDAALPFVVQVDRWSPNAELAPAGKGRGVGDRGLGADYSYQDRRVHRDIGKLDFPAAVVTLYDGSQRMGTWLASTLLDPGSEAQVVSAGRKQYFMALRFRRYYQDFFIELQSHKTDTYEGVETPRGYSSRVRVLDMEGTERREAVINMNEPLRHGGWTFFNGTFLKDDVVFQVVRNPGSFAAYMPSAVVDRVPLEVRYFLTAPGIALLLVGVGLAVHFGMALQKFLFRRLA